MTESFKAVADIIKSVSTPLQLVALAFLLIYGGLRLQSRASGTTPSAGQSRTIGFLFAGAMAALVIGVALPAILDFLQPMFAQDLVFRGIVRATGGQPVAGAHVTIGPYDTSTNPSGQFEITVPSSRALPDYKVNVSADGYAAAAEQTRKAGELREIEIRLQPQVRKIITSFDPSVVISQFYGLPHIFVQTHVSNPTPSIAVVTDVSASLEGPQLSVPLQPLVWTTAQPMGPYALFGLPFPLPAGMQADLRIGFGLPGNVFQLQRDMSALPDYAGQQQQPCNQTPNGSYTPLTSAAYKLVEDFAAAKFVWKEGEWRFRLRMTTEGVEQTYDKTFTLSAGDVSQLRASLSLIRRCLSARVDFPFAQDGAMSNFIRR